MDNSLENTVARQVKTVLAVQQCSSQLQQQIPVGLQKSGAVIRSLAGQCYGHEVFFKASDDD